MNDEAESSRAAARIDDSSPDHMDNIADLDPEEDIRQRIKHAKERRIDAKRKRIRMLSDLLRELDLVVYMELLALYHLECAYLYTLTWPDTDFCVVAHSSGLLCVH